MVLDCIMVVAPLSFWQVFDNYACSRFLIFPQKEKEEKGGEKGKEKREKRGGKDITLNYRIINSNTAMYDDE